MIYLQDNVLMEEPLKPEHIKHRLLGHWGTVPGLNLSGTADAVQLVPTPTGAGYLVLNRDGGVFTFGDAPFHGSAVGTGQPAVGLAPVIRG